METRRLGRTDLDLTTIGLGTWAIGGGDWLFGWGHQDEQEAIDAIVRGVELGINWIDTAAVYGEGRSEELVGRALKRLGPARRPVIATKCGRVFESDGRVVGRLNRDSVLNECDASLTRLAVDCIDLYQIHWPDPARDILEAWETLIELKRQGKVRHIGVSNFNARQLQHLDKLHPVASLQPPYSLLADDVESTLLPYCAENEIGVVAYSPMCKGLLTGQFTRRRAAELDATDHRSRDPKFQDPQLSINLALVEALSQIAKRLGATVAQLAIAWVLRRPEVTSAIVGARRPSQIEETIQGGEIVLDDNHLEAIEGLRVSRRDALAALPAAPQGRV
jgi:aryl-alcohol dehydrogenase-like predicted oxidoreductase